MGVSALSWRMRTEDSAFPVTEPKTALARLASTGSRGQASHHRFASSMIVDAISGSPEAWFFGAATLAGQDIVPEVCQRRQERPRRGAYIDQKLHEASRTATRSCTRSPANER